MPGSPELAALFAPELWGRLRWFVRLRWAAVAGLAAAAFAGPTLGYPGAWPILLAVAAGLGINNALLWLGLERRPFEDWTPRALRVSALRQIGTDLAALLITVLWTGGITSPALPFFGFHMALGTMLLGARSMYAVAGASIAALTAGHVALLARGHGPPALPAQGWWDLAGAAVAMVALVYLTGTLMARLLARTRELDDMARGLAARGEELQALLNANQQIEQRKSHYMRISAHQLRSPLATIKTTLDVLVGGYVDPMSEQGKKLMRGALDRTGDLLVIVSDLLELAKVREGLAKAPWSRDVNLNQLLADLFDSLAPLAEERKVRLVPQFEAVVILAWGVPPDLVFAFENVIENGIKYSHEGGTVTVRLAADGDASIVTVTDEGIGIAPEFLDQVFLEFVRAPEARRHTIHGSGLGLAVVRDVIQTHGGAVELTSSPGNGTVVTIRLPLRHDRNAIPARSVSAK